MRHEKLPFNNLGRAAQHTAYASPGQQYVCKLALCSPLNEFN